MAPNAKYGGHYAPDEWKNEGKSPYCNSPRTPLPARGGHGRACCKTHVDIPTGGQFPVEDTLDSLVEWSSSSKAVKPVVEYGYQATWRPCRTPIPVKDIMDPCTVCPSTSQFRSSSKYINPGTGAWSEKWRASRRYIDGGRSKDILWRSSVRTHYPHKKGYEEDYRPQIRPDPVNRNLESNQAIFKPGRRPILPYTPLKRELGWPQRRHIQSVNEWVPPFRTEGEDYNSAPKRLLGRQRVDDYKLQHPAISLAWDTPDLPGRPSTACSGGAIACVGPYACQILPTDESRSLRKIIPEGHLSHFETDKCCICKPGTTEKRTLRNRSASGPYHETAADRNPISGLLPETDVFRPTRVPLGPAVYAPAGTLNEDIIDHKFSDLRQCRTPLSEMRDQYRRHDLRQ